MQEKNLGMYALYASLWRNTTSIYKILHKKLEQELIVRNSSILEYRILKIIDEVEMITMAQIAERNYVTQAWITGMIDKMEGKNLVKRNRSEEDRRVIYIEITESGKALLSDLKAVIDKTLYENFSFVDLKEMEHLNSLLGTIKDNLIKNNEKLANDLK